tara:strand:+ start:1233 stop:3197 length:1965 start_codon:yes stop_codon:yes gene_type:complete
MWKEVEWDDLEMDISDVSSEMIIGPKNIVMRKINDFNRYFTQNTYVSGNRTMVEPLPPLAFTRTYRWKPGYMKIVNEVISERLLQLHKGGSLETKFNRMDRAQHQIRQLKERLLDIDTLMRELRVRKATTDQDIEAATENMQNVMDIFQNKTKEAESYFSLRDDMEISMIFKYWEPNTSHLDEDEQLSMSQINLLKFLTGHLSMAIHIKDPEMEILHSSFGQQRQVKSYGKIKLMDDIFVLYEMPFYALFQALYSSNFRDLKASDISNNYQYRNMIDGYLRGQNLNRSYEGHGMVRYTGRSTELTGWCGDDGPGQRTFPYISKGHSYETNNESFAAFGVSHNPVSTCFGNMDEHIRNAFVRLDFLSIMDILSHWIRYDIHDTRPLNNLQESFYTLPKDRIRSDFIKDYTDFDICRMHSKLFNDFDYDRHFRNYWSQPTYEYIGQADQYGMRKYQESGFAMLDKGWLQEPESPVVSVGNSQEKYRAMFGWDFSRPNWIPNSLIIMELQSRLAAYGFLDDDTYVDDHKDIKDVHITAYQEYIYALVDAVKRILDEDQCITIGHGLYKHMENLIQFVDNIEWTEIEEMHHKMKEKLKREINMVQSTINSDLPFPDEDLYEVDEYEYELNRVDFPGLLPGESPIQYERRMNEREDNNE